MDDTRKCFNPQLIIGNQFYLLCFIDTIIPTENIRKAEKVSRYFKGIYKDISGMKCVEMKTWGESSISTSKEYLDILLC